MKTRFRVRLSLWAFFALLLVAPLRAADTLPSQLDDNSFWDLIEKFSEPSGTFQSENFLSNETGFQSVIPNLKQTLSPGGVYMGVGPEQNFTYIAAIRPKMAFITDIRRQNMLEHMIYKALFEISADRADFLSKLFSRKRPAGLSDKSTVDELFDAYLAAPMSRDFFNENLLAMNDLLLKKHKFRLTADDVAAIEHVYTVFRDYGPNINYNSGSNRGGGRGGSPSYTDLMTATDLRGETRSYLASEENYRVLRELELKNLIVPLTGDFGGPHTIRAVGQYLKEHNATVSAFYLSNVEQYLFQGNGNQNGGWTNFYDNVAALPLDASSTFIRSGGGRGVGGGGGLGGRPNVIASIQEILGAVKANRIRAYNDLFLYSR